MKITDRSMKTGSALLICCIVFINASCATTNPSINYKTTMEGIIWIYLGTGKSAKPAGTGFVVIKNSERCLLATARHIILVYLESPTVLDFRIRGSSRPLRSTGRYIYDEDRDLGFVELNPNDCIDANLHVFPLLPSITEALIGEDVVVLGHPVLTVGANTNPIPRAGIVSSVSYQLKGFRRPVLLLDFFGANGFSGSPVIFKQSGQVIGVHNGHIGLEKDHLTGFSMATPIVEKDISSLPYVK